jgi:hypothetical protein
MSLFYYLNLPNKNIGRNTSEESYYYINMISLWNHPHHNAYPNPVTSTIPTRFSTKRLSTNSKQELGRVTR